MGISDVENMQRLKSNMDRFIGKPILSALQQTICLKSNMDRFIEYRMFIKDN